MVASFEGNSKCTEMLLIFGANVNALDKDRNSVLKYAARGGNVDCVIPHRRREHTDIRLLAIKVR